MFKINGEYFCFAQLSKNKISPGGPKKLFQIVPDVLS